METAQQKLYRLTAELETLLEQPTRDEAQINAISIARDEARKELEQEQAAQVRIQVQEEKVESIKLPHDFNAVFDDPRANEIIEELIKQFQRQAYNDHNQEIADLMEQHKTETSAASERELQLKRQNDELNTKLDAEAKQAQADAVEHANLLQQIAQLQLDKQDAEAKRDAAVREKEGLETLLAEKQSHIDKLRDEIAVGAKNAINVTAVESTDKLSKLVKESAEAKANRALERWNNMLPDVVAPPAVAPPALEATTFQPAQANDTTDNRLDNSQASGVPAVGQQEVTFPTVPTAEAPTIPGEVQVAIQTPEAAGTSGKTLEQRVEALEARVIELEKVCNLDESRVA